MRAAILLLVLLVTVAAQEIVDLGNVTGRRGIVLEKCKQRTDFSHFRIELKSGTNHIQLRRTNEVLRIADFEGMPNGPVLMSVVSVCGDGDESEIVLFRVTVMRGAPSRTQARPVLIPTNNVPQTLNNTLAVKSEFAVKNQGFPPMPPPPVFRKAGMSGLPLPGGTNKTYSEFMSEQRQRR